MSPRIHYRCFRCLALIVLAPVLGLVGCGSVPQSTAPASPSARVSPPPKTSPELPALPPAGSGRGGYYQDDGPGDMPPEDLLATPDAEPKIEPYSTRGNRPYVVFGKKYTPITDERAYKQRGIGSWYGKKFHGQKTSSGERYDMYKMTAAHPTLPIPSYARVTNVSNGKQVIVRVNDRGPFHAARIIDLSYTAALKLGYLSKGSSQVEVERLLPDEIARITNSRKEQQARSEQATPTPDVLAVAAAVQSVPEAEFKPPVALEAADALSAKAIVVSSVPATSSPGFYLQLGAYTQAANAEAARTRLLQNPAVAMLAMEVVEVGVFYRLYSGPYASRADAAAVALQLQDSATFKPMIVQR